MTVLAADLRPSADESAVLAWLSQRAYSLGQLHA